MTTTAETTASSDPLSLLQQYPQVSDGDREDLRTFLAWATTGSYQAAATETKCHRNTAYTRCERVRRWLNAERARAMRADAALSRAAFGGGASATN